MPTRAGSKKKSAKKTPKKTSAKKTPKKKPAAKKPAAKKPAAKKPAAKKPAAKKPAAKKPAAKKIPTKKSPAKVVAKPKATPATKSRVQWRAQINCEGGPVMVASAAAYAKWTGATRLPGAPPTVLHYWGQFTAELPEKFQPNGPGGHQYLKAPSHEAARALADELREAVKKRWPKAKDDWKWKKHDLEASFRLPDHRHMQLELATPTEYELACNAIDADTGVHHFADQAALFWEVQGSGAAHVGIADDGAELVLLRWWVDEDEYMDAARALVDTPRRDEDEQEATFTTKDGLVVVAWAAAPRAALKNAKTDAALRALVDKPGGRMDAEGFSGIGTVQRVRPGTYMARCGAHETDGWSCIWLRLIRRP